MRLDHSICSSLNYIYSGFRGKIANEDIFFIVHFLWIAKWNSVIFDRVFLNRIGILKTLCGDKVTKERENLSFKSWRDFSIYFLFLLLSFQIAFCNWRLLLCNHKIKWWLKNEDSLHPESRWSPITYKHDKLKV